MARTGTSEGDPAPRDVMREGGSSARARRDVLLLALLAVGTMAAYAAIERGKVDIWDGQAMSSVARNLLKHGSFKECCNAFGAFPRDPGPYAKFGIGYSLALVPLWHFQLGSNPDGAVWLGLANPLLLTATTVVIAKTGLVLGWRRSTAVLAALAFAFLTMAPLYSTEFFSDPGVTLGYALVVLGCVLWHDSERRGAPLIGIGVALAILFRPDSIVVLGPVVPLIILSRNRRELFAAWRSWVFRVGVPIALAVAWTLYYDALRYGSPFQVGYSGYYDTRGFSMPVLHGIRLLLFSGGKSFFLFSPILLASIPGMVLLAKRRAPLAIVIAVMFALRVAFYGHWWTPEGGNSWGPRFLLPLCAVLAIPLGEALERVHALRDRQRQAAIAGFGALLAASVVVEASSILVSYRDLFPLIDNVKSLPPSIQLATFDARQQHYLWTFSGNQILWNLHHIGSRDVHMPLYWFTNGATPFALAMITLAIVACTGAVVIARVSDRIAQQRPPGRTEARPAAT